MKLLRAILFGLIVVAILGVVFLLIFISMLSMHSYP